MSEIRPIGSGTVEEFGYKQELKRALTFKDLLFYGMVFMVPIAPFGIYGYVTEVSNGMAPLAYIIGIIAMAFTALSYARMSQAFPIAGSVYSYASRGISPYVGFFAGWAMLLDYILTPALVYLVAGFALQEMFPILPYWGYIALFVIINTAVNLRGIEMTARTNIALLVFEVFTLIVFCVVALVAVLKGVGAGSFTVAPIWKPEGFSLDMVMSATSLAVLSFLGFDAISTLAEETKDPRRMVGKATVSALVLVGSLFVLQTYLAGLVWPDHTTFDNPDTAFYVVAEAAGGTWLKMLCALATAVAWGIGDGLVAQAAISRLLYSMSRDKLMPSVLSKVHPKFQTPYVSTLLVAVVSITIGVALSLDKLTSLVNFGALTGFLFLHLSVFSHYVIRQNQRDLASLFKYLFLPGCGFAIIFYVWISLQPEAKTLGLIWLAIGLVYSAYKTKGFKEKPPAFRSMGH
ncbi:amino acid/polyamine/organocation transporter, APC superfamily [Desulforamulus putei DSM 12395]|uniref:Amino acid/polyamine/organocation transporter, APC superfamily n=1 Tax=Desulforamulus putei DSM 12395 TaxID=1121429 RepID=A0A1M4XKQ9_9FIRM|nr:APC family permease [Desulforamulus putei]SHE94006.1 amino acid/polyamine/organocation transporter, APC superfamily [Desulforamulus putei DSM 12395]